MGYGFCDLCVNVSSKNEKQVLRELLQKLIKFGYRTVVINQNVDEAVFDSEKKKKKRNDENDTSYSIIPEFINIKDLEEEFKEKLNILTRITFFFSDPVKTHSLQQLPVLKKYNLYAVLPKTQAAFQYACSQLNVDVILLNSNCSNLKLSRKLYLQAVERGAHFEIQYSDVIDSSKRKAAIHYSHLFHTFGKSKNVVISSGASNDSAIRSPYDIINLARLLGLNETKAKYSILQQAHHVLLKGEGRRYGKAMFKIESNENNDDEENEFNDSYNIQAKKRKL